MTEQERVLLYAKCGIPLRKPHRPLPLLELQEVGRCKQVLANFSGKTIELEATTVAGDAAAFAVKVIAADMAPRFMPGTILIATPKLNPRNRDFVLAYIHEYGRVLFRQYVIEDGEVELEIVDGAPDQETIQLSYQDRILAVVTETRFEFIK